MSITPQQVILDASALASLVQIAAQLVQEVEAIKAANPDAWDAVSQDYADAVAQWNAAAATDVAQVQLPNPVAAPLPSPVAAALASDVAQVVESVEGVTVTQNAAGHFNDARNSGAATSPAPAAATGDDASGLATQPAGEPAVKVSVSDGVQITPPL